jgi:hypothetical protein
METAEHRRDDNGLAQVVMANARWDTLGGGGTEPARTKMKKCLNARKFKSQESPILR